MLPNQYKIVIQENFIPDGSPQHNEILDAIADMNRVWQQTDGSEPIAQEREIFEQIIRRRKTTLVLAYRDEEIVGYAVIHPYLRNPAKAEFSLGVVKEAHQKRGIFTEMTRAVCTSAERQGFTAIVAFPTPEDDRSARVLGKVGFAEYHRYTDFFTGVEQLHLIKHLSPVVVPATIEGRQKTPLGRLFDRWRRR